LNVLSFSFLITDLEKENQNHDSDSILDVTMTTNGDTGQFTGLPQNATTHGPFKALERVTRLSNSPKQTAETPGRSEAIEVATKQGIFRKLPEKSDTKNSSESLSVALNEANSRIN